MTRRLSQRGQSLVEFSLTVGLLMLLVVATAQVAIYLHYRIGGEADITVGRRGQGSATLEAAALDRELEVLDLRALDCLTC